MGTVKQSWWEQILHLFPQEYRPFQNEKQMDAELDTNLPKYRTKERRAGFSSVHFQKEKTFKKIDKAIQCKDVTNLQAILFGLNFADFVDSAYDWMFLKKACESNALDIAAVLLRHNADTNHFGSSSVLPLHIAVRKGNPAMCALLLSRGAKVSTVTKYEHKTPLHFAVLTANVQIMHLLLEFKHEIDVKDIYGETPFHTACRLGSDTIVKALLDKKASIDAYDKDGWTGLHLAAAAGHAATVSLLLDQKANVNAQNIYGRTPLSWACTAGHVTVVQELLKGGADANIKDHNNKLAFQHAYNESIRKLVLLHTTQPQEPFFSTIGIFVQIDPRQNKSKSSSQTTVVNVLKLWQPVRTHDAPSRREVNNSDGNTNLYAQHKRGGSLLLIPEESAVETTEKVDKQKAFVSSYRALCASTHQSLASLEAELESVNYFVKMSKNASITSKNDIFENMIKSITNLAYNVGNLKSSLSEDFKQTLATYRDSLNDIRLQQCELSMKYMSIVNLFNQMVVEHIAAEEEGWRVFLKQIPFPSDLRNMLLVRLNLEESRQSEKVDYLINFWARNGEAFMATHETGLFMNSVLAALKKCDFYASGTRVIITKLYQLSQDFRTGQSSNTERNLEKILEVLSAKEKKALHNDITSESSDMNIFPDLQELTGSRGTSTVTPPASGEAENSDRGLKKLLSEAIETEDCDTLVLVMEHLIINKHEHLLIYLL